MSWRGQAPHPSDLQGYDNVQAGFAERVLAMSEAAVHAEAFERRTLAQGDVDAVKRGQYLSSVIVALGLIFAFVVIVLGGNTFVAALGLTPAVMQFASTLVRSVREPKAQPSSDDSSRKALPGESNGDPQFED